MPADPQRITAADADAASRRVAGALRARGVGEGDRVALVLPNSVDFVSTVLGITRAGAVVAPISPALLPHERAVIVDDVEPALVVDDAADLAALLDGPEVDLPHLPRSRPLHYTSGTTGRPKGVWSGLLDDATAAATVDEEVAQWHFAADDVTVLVSPLYHSAPLRFAVNTLLAGGTLLVHEHFDADALARTIATERPTVAFLVPTHLQRLLLDRTGPLPHGFRLVTHAGAPCPDPVKRAAIDAFGVDVVWEFFGATEGQLTACSSPEWLERPETLGRARAGRTLHVDAAHQLWCAPPPHARWEYWRDPVRTAAAWDGDAFTLGDLARIDADGYVHLDGRRDDLVITGGVNVYPVEVERALEELPGLVDIAVFGVPDARWGERVCAAVVGDVEPEAVRAYARTRVAGFKVPKDVYVVDEIPRSVSGKVRRSTLARDLGIGDA